MFQALHTYLKYASRGGVYSEWHAYLSRVVGLLNGGGMAYMFNFTGQQIHHHMTLTEKESLAAEDPTTSTDFLTKLLKLKKDQPEKFSDADVFGACLTNIGAGSDTTSVSLSGILYQLMKNPETFQKVWDDFTNI
jgi:hypothetical protein